MGLSSVSGLLTFVLLGALATVGALAWLLKESRSPGPLDADKVVMIVREDDGGGIADQLERAGVIDSALWFNVLTLLDGNRGALKRGEYAFKAGVSMNDIENELIAHRVVRYKLTIPEGLTSEQIVQRLRDDTVLVGDIREPPREGSLMPDTYFFERGDTRLSILSRMAKMQTKTIDEVWKARSPDLPIKSPGEMVTLASIVEKETGKADERPRVAGVFINRLEKHMRLEFRPDDRLRPGLWARARSAAASPRPTSISRRPITPTSSKVCRRGRFATPARRRWKQSPNPRAARTSTSSPTEPAGTPSPKRSISIRRMSPIGARSRRTSKTSSRRT